MYVHISMYVHDTQEHTQMSPEDSWKVGFTDRKIVSTAQLDPWKIFSITPSLHFSS